MKLGQKSNGVWFVDLRVNGVGPRHSTGTRDYAKARLKAREIMARINAGEDLSQDTVPTAGTPAAKGLTVSELFDLCLERKGPWGNGKVRGYRTIKSNIKILGELVGKEPVKSITTASLDGLADRLAEDKGYAPATVKRKLDTLSRALAYAAEQGLIPAKPKMPVITVNNTSERILEEHEEAAVWEVINARIAKEPQRQWTRFKHLLRWLLDGGFRLSEPLQATPEWVRTHSGRAALEIPAWATKTQKGRTVPLSADMVESLTYLRITSTNGKLFDMSPAVAWYMWDTVREDVRDKFPKLNIDDVKLHTFRHTCLTRLLRGGLPLHKVSVWAGHADISITIKRYAKVNGTDLMEGADILDSLKAPAGSHLKAVSA